MPFNSTMTVPFIFHANGPSYKKTTSETVQKQIFKTTFIQLQTVLYRNFAERTWQYGFYMLTDGTRLSPGFTVLSIRNVGYLSNGRETPWWKRNIISDRRYQKLFSFTGSCYLWVHENKSNNLISIIQLPFISVIYFQIFWSIWIPNVLFHGK